MIELDGSQITGGGQLLRNALSLSAHTNKPFIITNIRSKRPKKGLRPQHSEAIRVMQQLCSAQVEGNFVGSEKIQFVPYGFTPQPLNIHIGTAGSVTLLAQALLLAGMHHKKTTYTIHGGTDVRWAPPIDYLRYVVAPMLSHFGECKVEITRRGYYPKGGGQVSLTLGMKRDVKPLTILERGTLQRITCVCNASQQLLEKSVCEEVERTSRVLLDSYEIPLQYRNFYSNTMDPGYGVIIYPTHAVTEPRVLMGPNILGEEVSSPTEAASVVCERLSELLAGDGAVDEHLADHLISFMALHGGEIRVTRVSNHIRAAIAVAQKFTKATFTIDNDIIRVSRII